MLLGTLILAPGAFANFLTPKSGGSPNADSIQSLYKIVLYIAAVVFVIVEGALVYSVYRFRAKKNAVAAQIHGNTRLEIGWTVAAALILVVLTVVTFVKLGSIINPPDSGPTGFLSASLTEPTPPNGQKLTICVTRPPVHLALHLRRPVQQRRVLQTAPVLLPGDGRPGRYHRGAEDPVDGRDPLLVGALARRQGRRRPRLHHLHLVQGAHAGALYHGQCAQLCGREHYTMSALVKVIAPDQYAAWLKQQSALIEAANAQVTQLRAILTQNGNL